MVICCVPQCPITSKNRPAGVRLHRFPINEKKCNKWMKLIRRANYEWNMDTRICSLHFPNGLAGGPTKFPWNEDKSFDLTGLNPDSSSRKKKEIEPQVVSKPVEEDPMVKEQREFNVLSEDLKNTKVKVEQLENELQGKIQRIQELEKTCLESGVEISLLKYKLNKADKLVSSVPLLEKENQDTKSKLQGIEKNLDKNPRISYNDLISQEPEIINSMTGLHKEAIEILVEILKFKSVKYLQFQVQKLTQETQILILLLKLKLDLPNTVLAYFFNVSKSTVSNVINSLLRGFHDFFYEGQGPLRTMPSRTVIDCTEFVMESPSKLSDKKIMFSNYKSRYTIKVLVGCAPNGTVNFVSNLFGGSISDKHIVIDSNLLCQLEPGDLILADKGFEIFDILPQGVSLNIPSFLMHSQFTLNEIVRNRAIARARVIIERVNGRFKVFRILNCIKAENWQKANFVIKVCIALTTLMPTLMNELNSTLVE